MLAVAFAARTVLGIAFLFAGVSKLFLSSGRLTETMRRYGIANGTIRRSAGRVLPVFEAAIGASLFAGFMLPVIALTSILLLLFFNFLSYRALRRGKRFECSCFGALHATPVGIGLIIRNIGLMALAVCIVEYEQSNWLNPLYRSFTADVLKLTGSTEILAYIGLVLLFFCSLTLLEYSEILVNPSST
jgi:hypothetical protein